MESLEVGTAIGTGRLDDSTDFDGVPSRSLLGDRLRAVVVLPGPAALALASRLTGVPSIVRVAAVVLGAFPLSTLRRRPHPDHDDLVLVARCTEVAVAGRGDDGGAVVVEQRVQLDA